MNRTLPYSAYSSGEILNRERSDLFSRSWQYVGSVADFDNDIKAIPMVVNQLPVVLTRHDDEITALVNVCIHRGSLVCTESSGRDSMTCPYHAWRYALDGSLLSAPRSDREPDFDANQYSLEKLPVRRWGPFLFVGLSNGVMEFDEFLGDMPDLVKAAGIDVDSLVFHSRGSYDVAANWKICAENFLECYHCRLAHPDFAKTIDTSPENYELVTAPTFSTQYGPVRAADSDLIDLSGSIKKAQFHLLYPNTAVNIMAGEPNISIGPITPVSPDATHRFIDYFFEPEVTSDWIESMLAFDDQVGREDKVLVEDMQTGLGARPDRTGILFMDSEQLIDHFENYLRGQVSYKA